MIQPEPRVRAQERGPSCWFGTAFHRGGGFGSGDPADPESGAPAGTHERPRAFPAWPHAYKAGRPLPNHTFPTGWGGDERASRAERAWKFSVSVSNTSISSVPSVRPGP